MSPFYKNIWIAASISIAISASTETIACGPSLYTDETRFSLFNPNTIDDPALIAFSYTEGALYPYSNHGMLNDREKNNYEWMIYANNKFSIKDVDAIQYNTAPQSFIQAYEQNDWNALSGNEYVQWLRQDKAALAYMYYAKQVEAAFSPATSKIHQEDWSDLYEKHDATYYEQLIQAGLSGLQSKNLPSFLKERYAFQVLKTYYYQYIRQENQQAPAKGIDIYNQYLSNSNSIVAQWSLIYYAALQPDALARTKFLLKAFDKSDEKKVRAFRLLTLEDLQNLEQVNQDPYYRNMILVVKAMKTKGKALNYMKDIYNQDKNSRYLKLLIAREINKIEDWIWSTEVLKFHNSSLTYETYYNQYARHNSNRNHDTTYAYYALKNFHADKAYAKDVIAFVNQVQQGTKDYKYIQYCNIAKAHLYNVIEEHLQAEAVLKTMPASQTHNVTLQYQYNKIICVLNNNNLHDLRSKDLIAMCLDYLNEKDVRKPKYYGNDFTEYIEEDPLHPYNVQHQVLAYIGRKYIEKGDVVTGSLFLQKSGQTMNEYIYYTSDDSLDYATISIFEKYASPEDIDKLLALKHKKYKSSFEKNASPLVWAADNILKDLKGTLYIRQGQFEKALAVFNELPDNFWNTHLHYKTHLPLSSISSLGTYLPVATGEQKMYDQPSKKEIVADIVRYKQSFEQASTNAEKAAWQLNYANALFNMSYYGKAWMLYAYGQSSQELYNYGLGDYGKTWYYYVANSPTNHIDHYYGLDRAIQAYKDVLKYAPIQGDIGTIANLMLVRCDIFHQQYMAKKQQPFVYWNKPPTFTSAYHNNLKEYFGKNHIYTKAKTYCPDIH